MSTPVTILSGELGAGKTTLLSRLLESTDREVAVVVNDVGAVNVDADLVDARTELETGEEILALENGCICCGLGGELSRSVIRLQREREFDHLVIEASGVSEPEPIARQFVRGPAAGSYDLEGVVTVVDARRFFDRFAGEDGEGDGAGETDEVDGAAPATPTRDGPDDSGTRPLADLVLEQVEFCDLLVVNKCDLVSRTERERVVALLETLQPRAVIETTEYGSLDPDDLLGTQRFDLEAASAAAGWKRALDGDDEDGHEHGHDHGHDHDQHDGQGTGHDDVGDHVHPPEQYGITVDSYHHRRPFHPERLTALLESLPPELVRAKGLCWIAGRERQAITMSHAGDQTTLEVTGRWIASLPADRQAAYRRGRPDLEWDDEWGDRETRLALIGRDLDVDALRDRLDDCLLTDAEMDGDWSAFENRAPTSTGETVVLSSANPTDGD